MNRDFRMGKGIEDVWKTRGKMVLQVLSHDRRQSFKVNWYSPVALDTVKKEEEKCFSACLRTGN
jgi:hypothetical protein